MASSPTETPKGSDPEPFPPTPWTTLFAEADSPQRKERLESFCRAYWRPVYHFVRAVTREQPDTVKDLTQDFFEHLLEADLLRRYKPEQGRFRHFMKGALRNFLSQERRDAGRLKRGGGVQVVPLAAEGGSLPLADPQQMTPEQIFDRQWADEILCGAVEQLRAVLEAQGKEAYFRIYEAYDLNPGADPPGYADLAAAAGLATHDVQNRLSYARRLLRQIILKKVSEYAGTPEELVEEMRQIFGE